MLLSIQGVRNKVPPLIENLSRSLTFPNYSIKSGIFSGHPVYINLDAVKKMKFIFIKLMSLKR